LRWYHELKSEEEAADVLDISLSTCNRRWLSARLILAAAVQGRLPD